MADHVTNLFRVFNLLINEKTQQLCARQVCFEFLLKETRNEKRGNKTSRHHFLLSFRCLLLSLCQMFITNVDRHQKSNFVDEQQFLTEKLGGKLLSFSSEALIEDVSFMRHLFLRPFRQQFRFFKFSLRAGSLSK